MGSKVDWIFPKLKHPSKCWHVGSTVTIGSVGIVTKIIMCWLNQTRIFNRHILQEAVSNRPKNLPLLTVSNHHSSVDDPALWGAILSLKDACSKDKMRWSLAAHDICFTKLAHSLFFMFGKCIPVIRGTGVYQTAVDLCIQKLELRDWVHIFPEGRVNLDPKSIIRFKWGIGRMIYESRVVPIIIPVWHEGMDLVLPNQSPYIIQTGKKVTINVGKPIKLDYLICDLKKQNVSIEKARKLITDNIQEQMMILRQETRILHATC